MKTAIHTPGPWNALPAEAGKYYIRIRGQHLGKRYKIANVLLPVPGSADFEVAETCANARLIAAAPDLLEALEACYAALHPYTEEAVAARAAIAKATAR